MNLPAQSDPLETATVYAILAFLVVTAFLASIGITVWGIEIAERIKFLWRTRNHGDSNKEA